MAEKCGEACECYSRVTGYFRPVKNWNRGKVSEWEDRQMFKITADMKQPGILNKTETK